jgi:hypothetical protein
VLYELLGEGDRQTGRQRADKLPAAWLPATVACLVRGTLTPRMIAEAIKTTST